MGSRREATIVGLVSRGRERVFFSQTKANRGVRSVVQTDESGGVSKKPGGFLGEERAGAAFAQRLSRKTTGREAERPGMWVFEKRTRPEIDAKNEKGASHSSSRPTRKR